MIQTQELLYMPFAEGTVDPVERIARGEISGEKVAELASRIKSGEFTIYGDPEALPGCCMDCRHDQAEGPVIGAKAAGGGMTMVIGDALTTNAYRHPGDKAPTHKRRLWDQFKARVGGHIPFGKWGGCGAEFKLDNPDPEKPSILRFMRDKSDKVFDFMRGSLGLSVTAEQETGFASQADALIKEGYATTGEELAEVTKATASADKVCELEGDQLAVLVAVMTEPGAMLDQPRINQEYGPDYQVFEVEAWSIANGAKATALSEQEADDKNIGGVAYNVASAAVIVGPGMPFVIV